MHEDDRIRYKLLPPTSPEERAALAERTVVRILRDFEATIPRPEVGKKMVVDRARRSFRWASDGEIYRAIDRLARDGRIRERRVGRFSSIVLP